MFSDGFGARTEKKRHWSAFLGKGPITGAPENMGAGRTKITA